MKKISKIIAFIVLTSLVLSLCGCGGNKKAYEISKEAYINVNEAYELTDQYGSDIYEAWRLGIYEKDSISVEYLADELGFSEKEIENAIVDVLVEALDIDKETEEEYRKDIDITCQAYFLFYEDNLFSACVEIVNQVYENNGTTQKIEENLDIAKDLMKTLSAEYSDYEHYPNLKEYFTTTSSYFDFCENPEGSFEQIKETMNDYSNEARDYKSDLDYIFEE